MKDKNIQDDLTYRYSTPEGFAIEARIKKAQSELKAKLLSELRSKITIELNTLLEEWRDLGLKYSKEPNGSDPYERTKERISGVLKARKIVLQIINDLSKEDSMIGTPLTALEDFYDELRAKQYFGHQN